MALFDRLRRWMRGDAPKKPLRVINGQAKPSSAATRELEQFAETRRGVEAFVEPRTAIYSTTLLLVADDGEYLRRPLDTPEQARNLCKQLDIPLYDAAKVGYPKRMRDYDLGERPKPVDLSEMPPWPGEDGLPPNGDDDGPPPPPRD